MLRLWLGIGAAIIVVLSGCLPPKAQAGTDTQDFSQIDRGRYLTIVGDCAACHTQPGSSQPYAGGQPIETPFGTILASNITPDVETGIGAWSDEDFIGALTEGIGHDGKHLYPAMPYTYFTKMTRDDALSIRAYLRTLAPVHHVVEENQLSFPFNVRASLAAWNSLYFKSGAYQNRPVKSAEWNRGAYLIESLMHCGMCHTPKNSLGGDKTSKVFQGYELQGWFAPDITNSDDRGLGKWSSEDIVLYLKSGHNRFAAASGPMAEEVELSSSKMTDSDLQAIATYLKDQPIEGTGKSSTAMPKETTMKLGENIYADECSACHGQAGSGVAGLFPALARSPAIVSTKATSLIHVIVAGGRSAATDDAPTAPAMPAFGKTLSDKQVAAVATFIRNSWGNAASTVTTDDVQQWRASAGLPESNR